MGTTASLLKFRLKFLRNLSTMKRNFPTKTTNFKGTPLRCPENWVFWRFFQFLKFFNWRVGGKRMSYILGYFILKHFYVKSLDFSNLRQQKCIYTHQAQPSSRIISKKAKFCDFQSSNVLYI